MLRRSQQAGATHLVVPITFRWWLDHYGGFAQYLGDHAQILLDDHACTVYALRAVTAPVEALLSGSTT